MRSAFPPKAPMRPPTPQYDNYRIILKREGDEVEIGSIGIQHGAVWSWGIDTAIPMRAHEVQGQGRDRRDCMKQFKVACDRFAADEASLTEFLNEKRTRRIARVRPALRL